ARYTPTGATSSLKGHGAFGSSLTVPMRAPQLGQLPSFAMDVGVQNLLHSSHHGTEPGYDALCGHESTVTVDSRHQSRGSRQARAGAGGGDAAGHRVADDLGDEGGRLEQPSQVDAGV